VQVVLLFSPDLCSNTDLDLQLLGGSSLATYCGAILSDEQLAAGFRNAESDGRRTVNVAIVTLDAEKTSTLADVAGALNRVVNSFKRVSPDDAHLNIFLLSWEFQGERGRAK